MLPSKKILIAVAVLIVGIGALVFYTHSRGSSTDYTANQNILTVDSTTSPSIASQKDSDNDGLPDWEEALYGTNPNNPDTDGDSTPDGKEVALGRNPLVKGPNDFIVSKDNPVATSTEKEKLTLTDTFARNFFTQYVNIQQSGTKITSANADQVASDYLKNTPLPTISAKQYTEADLSLTDSDKAHIIDYQNSISAVFAKYWPKGKVNELNILQQAFVNNDPSAMNDMSSVISTYQSALNNCLTLKVPKLAVSLHLNVVNSLSLYIETLKMIQLAYNDPLSGLVGLNEYQTNQANVLVSLANLRMYFINSSK